MSVKLMPRARDELRAYVFHIAGKDPRAAQRERARIREALEHFRGLRVDGVLVDIHGMQRRVHRWYVNPFHVYYERQSGLLIVHRLYHHARRPIER